VIIFPFSPPACGRIINHFISPLPQAGGELILEPCDNFSLFFSRNREGIFRNGPNIATNEIEELKKPVMNTLENITPTQPPVFHYVGPEIFWGEIAPCEHLVNFYDNNDEFLNYLTFFTSGGFQLDETVILIATPEHLQAVKGRLSAMGLNPDTLRKEGKFITLDAQATLDLFMVEGWPDEELFKKTILSILALANSRGKRVRAFGEMVAILWANVHTGATVRLEHLWHELCKSNEFSLFCAYPRAGFTKSPLEAIEEIYGAHSKVVRSNAAN
jgi:hypothetical protein